MSEALALAIQTVIITAVLLFAAIALASAQGFVAARRLVRPIQSLASTAQALTVKTEAFDPALLTDVIKRHDELGQLAKVFQNMGVEVQTREQNLKQQVLDLRIEIDDAKKKQQVAEITETDYFRELQDKARKLRKQPKNESPEKA